MAIRVLSSFSLTLPDGPTIRFDPEPLVGEADSGSLTEDLTDLLVATGEAASERSTGVLLLIDEIQYLEKEERIADVDLSAVVRVRGVQAGRW